MVADAPGGPVLVLGATGTHGGAVAHGLLAAGFSVSALVRDPRSERSRTLGESGVRLVHGACSILSRCDRRSRRSP